ncbi:MAG: enoyl-CoA hydratase/isomerase family protein [Acidimicrobiales bacterium]|nr:enoyl-CoA hydratase/isomerase family protein [Acidimicrobiales bacterium]
MGISSQRHGPAEVITIDNPEAFNAITHADAATIAEIIHSASRDRSCRAVVLVGAGDRAFCAGIDVKSVAARDSTASHEHADRVDPIVEQFEGLHVVLGNAIRAIHRSPLPVIAAVNGHAIGAGFALAAAADLRVASSGAKFADGFIGRGISGCELGLSYFLPKIVGTTLAFELMSTGRRMEAPEALASGLVTRVVDPEQLVDVALELASQLASMSPTGVATTKEVMWANVHAASLDQALALESRNQVMVRNTADAAEARRAFLEKRTPEFGAPATPRPI